MEKIILIIFTGFASTFLAKAQTEKQATNQNQPIVEIILWDVYIPNTTSNFHPTCVTKFGNTADLAAYINLGFNYLQFCSEMHIEGRALYKVTRSPVLKVQELKHLCQDESKQLETILNGVTINLPPSKNEFIIELKVGILYNLLKMPDILPNW
jgi:hypothetical protein